MYKQLNKLFVCIVNMSFYRAKEIAKGTAKANFATKLELPNQQLCSIFSFLPVTIVIDQR